MSKSIFKRIQLSDIIGAGCGIFLLIVLIVDVITGMMPVTAGVKDEEIPPEAVTAIGVAPGRNDEVYVQVAATPDRIHQIKILYHIETDKIGTKSIKEIPQMIYDTQKVTVDAVTGSTLTSSAVKSAVIKALEKSGFDLEVFGLVPKVDPPTNLTAEGLAEYYGNAEFTEVYGGMVSDAGTVVFGSGYGAFSDVLVATLFDADNNIIGLIVDASGETEEKGMKCSHRDYTDRFIGVSSGKDVDVISGASFTSWAIQDAVDYALEKVDIIKGSA